MSIPYVPRAEINAYLETLRDPETGGFVPDFQAYLDALTCENYSHSDVAICFRAEWPAEECDDALIEIEEENQEFPDGDDEIDFARPGANSALRAATPDNPRDRPCPTCHTPNRLTRKDVALGYQCDPCADRDERGLEY